MIAYFRSLGARLANLSDGGLGPAGYRLSEERKKHLSNINIGKNKGAKRSRSDLIAMSRGRGKTAVMDELGVVYDHASEAARVLNLAPGQVRDVVSGKYKQARGHTFVSVPDHHFTP